MQRLASDEYIYAKAHGMWASSFVTGRAENIKAIKNVQDLYMLVFEDDPPLIPEASLTDLIEEKLTIRTIRDYTKLLSMHAPPSPLLTLLLYEYELINLKVAMSQAREKNKDTSFIIDITPYSPLKWNAWPALKEVTEGSIFSFVEGALPQEKQIAKEIEIDNVYCKAIWNALQGLSKKDYRSCESLVTMDLLLKNIVWLLRLKTYYNYDAAALREHIIDPSDKKDALFTSKHIEFVINAMVKDRETWKGWKYEWLINPLQEDESWQLDPRYAQAISDRYLYNMAFHSFHNDANLTSLLFSFFKLKRGEEYFIRQELEKLKVGKNMPFEAVMEDL